MPTRSTAALATTPTSTSPPAPSSLLPSPDQAFQKTSIVNPQNLKPEALEDIALAMKSVKRINDAKEPRTTKISELSRLVAEFKKKARGAQATYAVSCALCDLRLSAKDPNKDDLANMEYCLQLARKEQSDSIVKASLVKIAQIEGFIDKDSSKTSIAFDTAEKALGTTKQPIRAQFEYIKMDWLARHAKTPEDLDRLDNTMGEVAKIFAVLPQQFVPSDFIERFRFIVLINKPQVSKTTQAAIANMLAVRIKNLPAGESPKSSYIFESDVISREKPGNVIPYLEGALRDPRLSQIEKAALIHQMIFLGPMSPEEQLKRARQAYELTKNVDHYIAHILSTKLVADCLMQNRNYQEAAKMYDKGLQLAANKLKNNAATLDSEQISQVRQLRSDIIKVWKLAAKANNDDESLRHLAEITTSP